MKFPQLIFITIYIFILGCEGNEGTNQDVKSEDYWFEFPKINSQTDGVLNVNTDKQHFPLSYVRIGSSNLSYIEQHYVDSSFIDSIIYPKSWMEINDIKIFVDTNQTLSIKYSNREIPEPSTVDDLGNIIKDPAKPKYDRVRVLPVYIVSNNDSVQMIETHDYSLIMIQEALNKNGEWKPIEKFKYSGCGNSYLPIPLHKKNYILSSVIQYDGNYTTKLRIKLKTNGQLFYSNEYLGRVNEGQFERAEEFGISYLEKGKDY